MITSVFCEFVRNYYNSNDFIPLHAPTFNEVEENLVLETIRSSFVSSVGQFVNDFETSIENYTQSPKCVAVVNGTAALHISLLMANVQPNDLIITQALTFVATCNAINYCQAEPVFIDVDRETMSMSPKALERWLENNAKISKEGWCVSKNNERVIKACVPVHIFGHPAKMDELQAICNKWNIIIVEDASESLGSFYKNQHTGTFGLLGAVSFNGNKIITTGGGGMIMSNVDIAKEAKHITTTAKVPHPFEFIHDKIGFNYRMPNINAALGCAQIQKIENFIAQKRNLALQYEELFKKSSLVFFVEPKNCRSNYWLNTLICNDKKERDEMLVFTNSNGIVTRPPWKLMNELPIYQHCMHDELTTSMWLQERIINLPSSVKPN